MSFEGIIGHAGPIARLKAILASGRIAGAYLFTGPDGVGKRMVAEAFARAGYPQVAGPYSTRAAAGFITTVGAAERFSHNGRAFVFDKWSDGAPISHDVSIPSQDLVLTARYRDAGPAPFSGTSAGLTAGGDKLGPVIRLDRRSPMRRLTGTVSDPSGVSSLKLALRASAKSRGCRWWNKRSGHLARRTRCAKPRWMKPVLKRIEPGMWAWSLRLGGRLPRGRYTLLVRAADSAGNRSDALAGGTPGLRVGR